MSHIHNMVAKIAYVRPSAALLAAADEGAMMPPGHPYLVCEGPAADAEDPYRNGCGLDSRITKGTPVRVVNWAGPCLNDVVEKVNKTRYKLEWHGAKHFIEVHKDPCNRCTDHPQSQYPNGYTN